MSRLGVLYALKDDELNKLCSLPQAERYDYMLEEIEESLLDTPRGCELDKAWDGIQYCLGGGTWKEGNSIPANIVFGGEFLVETEDEIITLKKAFGCDTDSRLSASKQSERNYTKEFSSDRRTRIFLA